MKYQDKNKVIELAGGELNIYGAYLPGLNMDDPGKLILSPFRNEKTPSFNIYENGGKWKFKDLGGSAELQGDIFQFVAMMEGIEVKNFKSILDAINKKLRLNLDTLDLSSVKTDIWKAEYLEFTPPALEFWAAINVTPELLSQYQVRQLAVLTYKGKEKPSQFQFARNNQIAFEYRVGGRFKLYAPKQPGIDSKYFVKTQINDDVFGLEQLPPGKVPLLLICEGEKDALCAIAHGFHAVSFQSANTNVTVQQIRKLFEHACDLVICYDNDSAGHKNSADLSRKYLMPVVKLPEGFKDIAEFLPKHESHKGQLEELIKGKVQAFKRENNMAITEKDGQYWATRKTKDGKEYEVAISNFTIQVDAFVSSNSESKRILRIKGASDNKFTAPFSVLTDQLTSPDLFRKLVESKGNYFFSGSAYDLLAIKQHCFRLAAMAEEVPHLGHYEYQEKPCFVLSNAAWLNDRWHTPDKFGIIEGMQVPSSAIENRFSEDFKRDRSFRLEEKQSVKLYQFIEVLSTAYGVAPTIIGFSFIFATLFFDHIAHKRNSFPLLLVFGQKGSGKSSFPPFLMSFFGSTIMPDANLQNATPNSLNKMHEQRANIPILFEEFKNNILIGIIERLKGLFDLMGRAKAIDSSNRTKSSQIKTSTIVIGQEFPTDEALFSRCIVMDFPTRENSEDSRKRFLNAKSICSSGLGHLIPELLKHRSAVITDFQSEFIKITSDLTRYLDQKGIKTNSRLVDNYATILAPLVIGMRNGLKILESQAETDSEYSTLIDMFAGEIEMQSRMESKMDEVMIFWECVVNMKGKHITPGEDIVITDNKLGFKPTVLYEFQKYFRSINGKEGPNKDAVLRYMSKRNYYKYDRMYFNGKQARCHTCNLDLMPEDLRESLLNAFSFSVNQSGQ